MNWYVNECFSCGHITFAVSFLWSTCIVWDGAVMDSDSVQEAHASFKDHQIWSKVCAQGNAFNIISSFNNVQHDMCMPFVVTVHQYGVVETFFETETRLLAFETEPSRDLKNLETETFKFRVRADTFYWNETARLSAKNGVNVGICNCCWFSFFYLMLLLYGQNVD